MFGVIFVLMLLPFIALFILGVPIIIGIFVYRDAKKRDTNPLLWAIVSALTPSFIGLIVYLIVRNDYPLAGSYSYEEKKYTTSDGETYTTYEQGSGPIKKTVLPTWGKVLIVIGMIISILFIISVIGMFAYNIFDFNTFNHSIDYGTWI